MGKPSDFAWIFKTPFRDWVSFFKNRLGSSKYIVKGSCKQCGQCCENILFSDEKGYIKTTEAFKALCKQNIRYRHFFANGTMDETQGPFKPEEYDDPNNQAGALLFKCKSLGDDKRCKHYLFRALSCRDYPIVNKYFISQGGTTLDGCGFYFDIDKKFKDYLLDGQLPQ